LGNQVRARIIRRIAASLLLAAALSGPLRSAADDIGGVISGVVTDQANHPIRNARVVLSSSGIPTSFRNTSPNGRFLFLAVLPGQYFVSASQPGYDGCYAFFAIYPNQTKSVRFRLPSLKRGFFDHCRSFEPVRDISF
jgi:hypothetical protein